MEKEKKKIFIFNLNKKERKRARKKLYLTLPTFIYICMYNKLEIHVTKMQINKKKKGRKSRKSQSGINISPSHFEGFIKGETGKEELKCGKIKKFYLSRFCYIFCFFFSCLLSRYVRLKYWYYFWFSFFHFFMHIFIHFRYIWTVSLLLHTFQGARISLGAMQ